MNKRKILRCLLSASIIGSVFSIGSVKTFAEWRNDNNTWKYVENNENVTGWHKYNDNWYYFNNEGVMQTGWVKDNGSWYYLNESGDMKTGWVKDNGLWYYLDQSGSMKTGWVNDNGTWYYMNQSGDMKTGWAKVNNEWYYLAQSGEMKTEWVNDNGTWYYLNKDGAMQTGVISVSDKVYYLNESGAMQTGSVVIDGQAYEFSSNGEAVGKIPSVPKDKVFGVVENVDNKTENKNDNPESTETKTEGNSSSSNHHSSNSSNKKKWNLVWNEDFDGDQLDKSKWSCELREPGWVNNELQEYTDSEENVFIKDGNLVLKAIKSERDGKPYYTSGKVSTQDKITFKYGKFEIKAKSPKGQGLWPALWMMPNDESLYGQWPKCGEIDIMEILGNEPDKVYGTIHYGDPHEEQQGTYKLTNGTFADDYHVYGVEWEPGEIRFYVDGNLYHKTNDWFTTVEGGDEVTFPAPFDQEFYMQCNLAVGGSWPGNPDETTDFDNAEFKVDYIKVYQLDSYNENVKKPEAEEVILREPDANGNYVINGDFSKDDNSWELKNALNGVGTYKIADNKMVIKSENEGTVDYSIQLVQPGIPLKEGGIYRVSFDAKAGEDRTMVVDVSGPDRSYVRYLKDTKVELTTDVKNYSYEFTMEKKDDANGRLEFNLGNQGSLADVELSNVKIEKIGQIEKTEDDSKKIMPDGNYVNNGTFDVGENRMKYWEVNSKSKNTKVDVTNTNNSRELKVNVKDKSSKLEDVIVKQTKLALKEDKEYVLYFDAYADSDKTITARINGEEFNADLTNKKKTFKFNLKTGDELINKNLEFLLGLQGITYLDNVRIEENSLIRNGSFDSGFAGWEVYADGSISSGVSSGVDSLKNDNAAEITIANTGDADWKIQLKQSNVKLEEGKKYKLSFDAKSTIDRDIMYAIQRDGSSDNDWTTYTGDGSKAISVGQEYKNYSVGFEMKKATDENAIFTISMGAVGNKQITDKHTVTIDNVVLEEVDEIEAEPEVKPEAKPENGNFITNGDFSSGVFGDEWMKYNAGNDYGIFTVKDEQAKINVADTYTNDYDVQIKQAIKGLEKGKTYKLSLDLSSTIDREILFIVQENGGEYKVFSDAQIINVTGEDKTYELEFTMNENTTVNAVLAISMGTVNGNHITEGHEITIDNISLVEVPEAEQSLYDTESEEASDKVDDIDEQESGKVEDTEKEEVKADESTDKFEENEVADVNDSTDKDVVNEEVKVDESIDKDELNKEGDTEEVSGASEDTEKENNQEVKDDESKNDVILDESVEDDQV